MIAFSYFDYSDNLDIEFWAENSHCLHLKYSPDTHYLIGIYKKWIMKEFNGILSDDTGLNDFKIHFEDTADATAFKLRFNINE